MCGAVGAAQATLFIWGQLSNCEHQFVTNHIHQLYSVHFSKYEYYLAGCIILYKLLNGVLHLSVEIR